MTRSLPAPYRGALGVLIALAFAVAATSGRASGDPIHASAAIAGEYLPIAILVTVCFGVAAGLASALAADALILLFLLRPQHFDLEVLGAPGGVDQHVLLVLAAVGMLLVVGLVGALERRRARIEMLGRAEAETLGEFGRRISESLDLSQVLGTAVESAQQLVNADMAAISIVRAPRPLRLSAVVGNRTDLLEALAGDIEQSMSRAVLDAGEPLHAHWDGTTALPTTYEAVVNAIRAERIVSTVAVPIRRGRMAVGVFWVHSRQHREFSDREVNLLERLAAQTAAAIENARILAEERIAHAEVEGLLACAQNLTAEDDPEQVLRTLVERAADLLGAERAIYAVQRGGRLVVPAVLLNGRWVDDEHDANPGGILMTVWGSGLGFRTANVSNEPNAASQLVDRHGLRTQLTMPISGPGQEHLGVVSLNNKREGEFFNEHDERLLAAICETGAVVLARAHERASRLGAQRSELERQREVEALLAAADQLASAVEPEEVLRRVLAIAAELLDVDRAGIATNEGDHVLRRHTLVFGAWSSEVAKLAFDSSIAGRVISSGKPFRSSDLDGETLRINQASSPYPVTVLAVPILRRDGHVLGSLQLFDRRDGLPFTDQNLHLAEGIAHHAAVAMERAAVARERAALVDELQRQGDNLRRQAVTDPLTGLPNRSVFLDRLSHALATAGRRSAGIAVLFLDLDGFKLVNDSLGHAAGDALLRSVAARLVALQREGDTIARFGGDEFAVLLEDVPAPSEALRVAGRLLTALKRPFSLDKQRGLFTAASIGVSHRSPVDEVRDPEDLLREADIALYQAKAQHKGRAIMFAPSMGAQVTRKLELQMDLQRALLRDELRLLYQPLLHLKTGRLAGAEALVRWQHPTHGLLTPAAFMSMAEETGLIFRLGRWVLEEACRQAADWQESACVDAPLLINVNLSARQLEQADLSKQVASALKRARLRPESLILEITETAVIRNPESAIATLVKLNEMGVGTALDDFGTGYSSLGYLERLPVRMLKIDQSFAQRLDQSTTAAAIMGAAVSMAHALGIEVVAEGIESSSQLTAVSMLGCDYAQGFLLDRPLEPAAMLARLERPMVAAGIA